MSNPQKENGYTGIANEILERIMKQNLNGTQFRIVLAVWRFTYGFQRKGNEMSINFIVKHIEADRRQVIRELNTLLERNILLVVETGPRKSRVISFNKRYDEWTSCIPKTEEKNKKDAAQPSPAKVKKKTTTKKKIYEEQSLYFRMAKHFYNRVSSVAEAEGLSHLINKADLQKWADDMRKLVEIDKVDTYLARDVMDWLPTDDFWKVNILSSKKLREKFTDLALKMKVAKKTSHSAKPQIPDARDKEIAFQKWVMNGGKEEDFNWGD